MAQNVFTPVPLEFEYNGQFFTLTPGVANSLPDAVAAFAVAKFGSDKGLTYGTAIENSEGN